jgi:hypothetical protein
VYSLDPSGTHPDYRATNVITVVFKKDQVITFDSPVFLNSISISTMGTIPTPMTYGVDWTEHEVDDTSIGYFKTTYRDFDKTLIKSISIIRNVVSDIRIKMDYQQIHSINGVSVVDGSDLTFTPQLLGSLLSRISNLEINRNISSNQSDVDVSDIKMLLEDQHKKNLDNYVSDEVHLVNTFDRKNIITPIYGAFFRNSVKIETNTYTLIRDVDYVIVCLDREKTRRTDDPDGVYTAILVTYAYAGELKVSYHAYGGQPTIHDIITINRQLSALREHILAAQYLTIDGLSSAPLLTEMKNRLDGLDGAMRALSGGLPNYGDVTNGIARKISLTATNTNLNWFTIATLYKVTGSSDIYTSDRMKFRMKLQNAGIMADVSVSVDVLTSTFIVESTNVVQDLGYSLYGDISVSPVTAPLFRVVFNNELGTMSGICLQIGIPLYGLQEVLGIEDTSGIESCWKLVSPNGTVSPSNTDILLPDGVSIWSSASDTSYKLEKMMPPASSGYLLWHGAEPFSDMEDSDAPNTLQLSPPVGFVVDNISHINLEISEESFKYTVPVTLRLSSENMYTGLGQLPIFLYSGIPDPNGPFTGKIYGLRVTYDAVANTMDIVLCGTATASINNTHLRYITAQFK